MALAGSKSTHPAPGAQCSGEQQLDQRRLFNLGDKEIISSYWRMRMDKSDSRVDWGFFRFV